MKESNTPVNPFALRFLKWVCPEQLYETIEGDLLEQFEEDLLRVGNSRAKANLLFNALKFIRPGIINRKRRKTYPDNPAMVFNYIKIAFRSFRQQKGFTALNSIGLSLGMTAAILILQYVKYEKSYDSFHSNAGSIYRVQYNAWHDGQINFQSAVAVPAVGPALKNNFQEVEAFTRLWPVSGLITYQSSERGPVSFREKRIAYADPFIFTVFDFKVVKGNSQTALKDPYKVMLSRSTALKYFGIQEPVGKILKLDHEEIFEVTGVFEDVPANSHIKFDMLLSYETLKVHYGKAYQTSWGWYDFYTYILLKPGTDVDGLQVKWDRFLVEERKEDWKHARQEFILRPLTDIHLYSDLQYEALPNEQGDGDSVKALTLIAFFILIIAWVNYVNLATARSINRANEVGVRKVIGAGKGQLIMQFFIESVLLNFFAVIIALLIIAVVWPSFVLLTGRAIPVEYFFQKEFMLLIVFLFVSGIVLSGLYPAIVLSSFQPVAVLRGKINHSAGGNFFRKSMVVFQFTASVFLICSSVIVYQQLNFMKNRDLGISIDKTLVLNGPGVIDSLYDSRLQSFSHSVLQIAGVKSITSSTNIPGDEIFWTNNVVRFTGTPKVDLMAAHVAVDHAYIPSFELKLVAGRNFTEEKTNDRDRIIVNTKMTELLGFSKPELAIGQHVLDGNDTTEIIGVLHDYHQRSVQTEIEPLVFRLRHASQYYSLKIEADNYKDLLAKIEVPWKESFTAAPFDYFFLDQFYNHQYDNDHRFSQVVILFTGLAVFIALLGLFGLASFMATRRTKEIGIRKILGSGVGAIVLLLSKGYITLVIIANLIAWPLTWWIMHEWLQSFPFRISIHPAVFVVAGFAVLLISLLSVSFQTLKTAMMQPAETLKYE